MALTPSIIAVAPGLASRLARGSNAVPDTLAHARESLRNHVIILGYGLGGQLLARSLAELSIPHIVLELNGATVRAARESGVNIHYADVSAPEPLAAAGVEYAAAVVVVISDPDASERAVRAVRAMAPSLPIITRTRYRLEAERLARSGATLAVAEELEASLEVLSQLLARLHIPGNVVETLVDNYRRVLGAAMTRAARARAIPFDQLPQEIVDAPVSSFRLDENSWAVGRTLQDLNLRSATGATVIAVRRATGTITSPDAAFALAAGDDIFLLGDDSDVLLARGLLSDGPRGRGSKLGTGVAGPRRRSSNLRANRARVARRRRGRGSPLGTGVAGGLRAARGHPRSRGDQSRHRAEWRCAGATARPSRCRRAPLRSRTREPSRRDKHPQEGARRRSPRVRRSSPAGSWCAAKRLRGTAQLAVGLRVDRLQGSYLERLPKPCQRQSPWCLLM
jgi:voltage-gated potassium channel Kch/K+/H+ antiporter YhaU regulatory subunit KhtT